MSDQAEGIRAVLDSVRVDPPATFTVLARRHELPAAAPPRDGVPALQAALAESLYATLHCRTPSRASATSGFTNGVGAREFVDRLSAVNLGTGTWQSGWTAKRVEADGRIVVERHGLEFWAPPGEFRHAGGPVTPGIPGAVRIAKECFELASGFYLAYGNADDARDAGDLLRLYWHLAPTGAERMVRVVTEVLNRGGIPFQFKVESEPLRFQRTDPAVLYLARSEYARALPQIAEIHAAIAPWLRSTVSFLVKRLAAGVGLAEDPGDGSSFGEHRGRLLAAILTDPEWGAQPSADRRMAFVSSRLARDGYDIARLHLNPGSPDDLPGLPGASGRRAP